MNKKEYEEFTAKLLAEGVHYLVGDFSGSGDSGWIEDYAFLDNNEDKLDITFKELDCSSNEFETFINEYITDYDWWNNEGGYGSFQIDLKENKINVDYHIAEITYEEYNDSKTVI